MLHDEVRRSGFSRPHLGIAPAQLEINDVLQQRLGRGRLRCLDRPPKSQVAQKKRFAALQHAALPHVKARRLEKDPARRQRLHVRRERHGRQRWFRRRQRRQQARQRKRLSDRGCQRPQNFPKQRHAAQPPARQHVFQEAVRQRVPRHQIHYRFVFAIRGRLRKASRCQKTPEILARRVSYRRRIRRLQIQRDKTGRIDAFAAQRLAKALQQKRLSGMPRSREHFHEPVLPPAVQSLQIVRAINNDMRHGVSFGLTFCIMKEKVSVFADFPFHDIVFLSAPSGRSSDVLLQSRSVRRARPRYNEH